MSFTEKDRNFRSKSGKTFPIADTPSFSSQSFNEAVADALRRDFGGSPAAVKRVAKLVTANERAVKNWFEGRNGPNGEHLVSLMHHSTAVLETVLGLSGRHDLLQVKLVTKRSRSGQPNLGDAGCPFWPLSHWTRAAR
jgi:hypothetical protein